MTVRLYIRMQNGRPVDHPMLEENVLTAFPEVDLENLPDWLAPFDRVLRPPVGVYEIANGPVYVIENGRVRDQWIVRPMTAEEILIKQNRIKQYWEADGKPSTWVFNEEKCCMEPPVPYPQDGGAYIWVEQAQNWVSVVQDPQPLAAAQARTPYPHDGNLYEWDEDNAQWIPMVNIPGDQPPAPPEAP